MLFNGSGTMPDPFFEMTEKLAEKRVVSMLDASFRKLDNRQDLVMAQQNGGMAMQKRLDQFRAMENETTDPFAARLIREIVVELETRLIRSEKTIPPARAKTKE